MSRPKDAELVAIHPTWEWALEHALWLRQNEGVKCAVVYDRGWWCVCKPVYRRAALAKP